MEGPLYLYADRTGHGPHNRHDIVLRNIGKKNTPFFVRIVFFCRDQYSLELDVPPPYPRGALPNVTRLDKGRPRFDEGILKQGLGPNDGYDSATLFSVPIE